MEAIEIAATQAKSACADWVITELSHPDVAKVFVITQKTPIDTAKIFHECNHLTIRALSPYTESV